MTDVTFTESAAGGCQLARLQPKGNVLCLPLFCSVGPIGQDTVDSRRPVVEQLFSVYPEETARAAAATLLQSVQRAEARLLARCAAGESMRLWSSRQPDELCGLYRLLAKLPPQHGRLDLVMLPEDGPNSWGEVPPGEWKARSARQQEISAAFAAQCAQQWRQLQAENAPLRVIQNGQPVSAPADFYDSCILQEVAAQPAVFSQAPVIGTLLGKYHLGVCDGWIALRMEAMIEQGMLQIVTQAPKDSPAYHRMLKKRTERRDDL